MSRRPDIHLTVAPSARSARAYRLVDDDPPKRIDDYIDYFGSGGVRSSVFASPALLDVVDQGPIVPARARV